MHSLTHAISRHLARLRELADIRARQSIGLTLILETLMKTDQDLTDEIAALGATIAAYEAARDTADTALQSTIAQLQAQIAAGAPATDFTAFVDQIEAIRQGIVTATPAPTPPPAG